MTVSAGVALARDGEPTAEALLRNADTALSAAKSGGRDRSTLFDTSLHERAMQRLETERALVRALAGKAIEARFQPIVSSDQRQHRRRRDARAPARSRAWG